MASIFPWESSATASSAVDSELPLCVDGAWDFDNDCPIFRAGQPVKVTGVAAVKVWAWHALKTDRYCHQMFSPQYGQEIPRLIGRGWSAETTKSEVARYVTECLSVSPYISSVTVDDVVLTGDDLSATVTIETIYGGSVIYV